MCDLSYSKRNGRIKPRTVPVAEAAGLVLAHDITEIRNQQFKGTAFRKGYIVRQEDIAHLRRLGKEHLPILEISGDDMHEDDAAYALAKALMGEGTKMEGEPKEGRINMLAEMDGLLKVNPEALLKFNMLGDVMCATLHDNTTVKKGQVVAGTRAIPLLVKRKVIEEAIAIARRGAGVIRIKEMRRPKTGLVITGNEVYYGTIKDAFAPVVIGKIKSLGGEFVGMHYAPDDETFIENKLRELIEAGADLLITTGGMSVDPDDVTRYAIENLGAVDLTYGSPVLPGAMFLIAYIKRGMGLEVGARNEGGSDLLPILGIPACAMYYETTIFDLVLPRILAGEFIGRKELAQMGHGGLCLNCKECRYPVCSFGK